MNVTWNVLSVKEYLALKTMMTLSGEANSPVHTRPEEFENGRVSL